MAKTFGRASTTDDVLDGVDLSGKRVLVTGVSAGAINAACLAARTGSFAERVEYLAGLWKELTADRVFRVDGSALASNAIRAGLKLVSGSLVRGPDVRSLVDTAPLRELLAQACESAPDGTLPGIARNVAAGAPRAVAITAASTTTITHTPR